MSRITDEMRKEKEKDWKDSYKGKMWSTAVQKCFEAPFVEVAIQHLLMRIDENHQKEIKSVLEAACEEIEGMKRYHNKAHTWITDGWCHACKKSLTRKQLEDEFIYNQAIDDILALLRESAK